jgi:signal transduction histidine kinase
LGHELEEQVMRSSQAGLVSEVSQPSLERQGYPPEVARLLAELGTRHLLVLPLRVRARPRGTLTLGRRGAAQAFLPHDLAVAKEFAACAAMTLDNAALYRTAQEAVRRRDEFLSIASHELKSPLTALQLKLQLLERNDGTSKAFVTRLFEAERQVRRLTDLVNTLLDVTRIGADRLELRFDRVDLTELVRQVCERFREDAERTHTELTQSPARPCFGHWDKSRLEQIITNLVSNALKYGAGRPVELEVSGDTELARFTVRDHGIGIAPVDQARIFDRFERAATAEAFSGLGLGLYISNQIARAHGGELLVWSQPGQGAAFTLVIPRQPPEQRRPLGPVARPASPA